MADPMEIPLRDAPPLHGLELVRELPGKRRVWRGEWQGRGVYGKLYLDPGRAAVHWGRERRGIEALERRGVPTARLLHAGRTLEGHPILLLEEIPALPSLRAALESADPEQRESLLGRMVALLADHHRKGICQTDLHFGNFLVGEDRIHTLDGAGVTEFPEGSGAPAAKAGENLALFLAQLSPAEDGRIDQRVREYLVAGGSPSSTSDLAKKVAAAREGRWKEFRGKLTRECTAFTLRKERDGFTLLARHHLTPEVEALVADPNGSLAPERLVKKGNTCTVWWVPGPGAGMLVKRYNPLGLWHGIRQRLSGGRGLHSWIAGHRLGFYGLATPRLYGLVVRREGMRQTAWLIGERLEAPRAREWFLEGAAPWEEKTAVARRIVALLSSLHALGISHGDLKASNILLPEGVPTLIDLDAMRCHTGKSSLRRAWGRDLKRFRENWDPSPEIAALFEGLLNDAFGGNEPRS